MKKLGNHAIQEIRAHLMESVEVQRRVAAECIPSVLEAAGLIAATFRARHRLLLCGNGGSASDCQHLAAEFVGRLSKHFERPGLPAISLTADTSVLTAVANDRGFDRVFERQVFALGRRGDALLAISTSGNSANVLRAVRTARKTGMRIIGLQGEGGRLGRSADVSIVIPSRNTQHIQEALLSVEHVLCHLVETELFGQKR